MTSLHYQAWLNLATAGYTRQFYPRCLLPQPLPNWVDPLQQIANLQSSVNLLLHQNSVNLLLPTLPTLPGTVKKVAAKVRHGTKRRKQTKSQLKQQKREWSAAYRKRKGSLRKLDRRIQQDMEKKTVGLWIRSHLEANNGLYPSAASTNQQERKLARKISYYKDRYNDGKLSPGLALWFRKEVDPNFFGPRSPTNKFAPFYNAFDAFAEKRATGFCDKMGNVDCIGRTYENGAGHTLEDNILHDLRLDHVHPADCINAAPGSVEHAMRHLLDPNSDKEKPVCQPTWTNSRSSYFDAKTLSIHAKRLGAEDYEATVMDALEAVVGPLIKDLEEVSSEAQAARPEGRNGRLSAKQQKELALKVALVYTKHRRLMDDCCVKDLGQRVKNKVVWLLEQSTFAQVRRLTMGLEQIFDGVSRLYTYGHPSRPRDQWCCRKMPISVVKLTELVWKLLKPHLSKSSQVIPFNNCQLMSYEDLYNSLMTLHHDLGPRSDEECFGDDAVRGGGSGDGGGTKKRHGKTRSQRSGTTVALCTVQMAGDPMELTMRPTNDGSTLDGDGHHTQQLEHLSVFLLDPRDDEQVKHGVAWAKGKVVEGYRRWVFVMRTSQRLEEFHGTTDDVPWWQVAKCKVDAKTALEEYKRPDENRFWMEVSPSTMATTMSVDS